MSTNLFEQKPKKKNFIEFKAGKMIIEGDDVKPDLTKGIISLNKEEGLIHFNWSHRDGTIVDELILFPDEAKFSRIVSITSSIVFLLEINDLKKFYWLQEFKEDNDCEELVKKINSSFQTKTPPSQTTTSTKNKVTNKPTTTAASSTTTTTKQSITVDDIKGILSNIPQTTTTTTSKKQKLSDDQNLYKILNIDTLCSIIQKYPDIAKKLKQYLPKNSEETVNSLCEQIRSSQFKRTLRIFSEAFSSGQLGSLFQSMELDPNLGAIGNIELFFKALQEKEEKKDKMEF